jgi:hypothetical protein
MNEASRDYRELIPSNGWVIRDWQNAAKQQPRGEVREPIITQSIGVGRLMEVLCDFNE